MKIRTEIDLAHPFSTWVAYDADTYDGAPDAGRSARRVGYGNTEHEAVADLLRQMEEGE